MKGRMGYKEFPLANTSDLGAGEMKEILVGETRILLARVGDCFQAVSAACPHYGAPLVEGVLSGERVVCPWGTTPTSTSSAATWKSGLPSTPS